ncbi:MAG: CsgG/HfaB family protein [Bacteroidota bacterium]
MVCFFISVVGYSQSAAKYAKDAENYYRNSDYPNATLSSIQSLKIKSTNKKALEIINLSLPAAVSSLEDEITELKDASEAFKGERTIRQKQNIVKNYLTLNKIKREFKSLPPLSEKKKKNPISFEFRSYYEDLNDAKDELNAVKIKGAEMHYEDGKALFAKGGKKNCKNAAKKFTRCLELQNGFKDASDWYKKAREAATIRVAVIPFLNTSGKNHYGNIGEVITDKVIASMLKDRKTMEFVELISRDQLQTIINEQNLVLTEMFDPNSATKFGEILGVHCLVTGKISQIVSVNRGTTSARVKSTKSVVVRKEPYYNKNGKLRYKNIYGDVSCYVNTYKKEANASVNGSYQVVDVETGQVLKSDSFSEKKKYMSEWATFSSGDERAVKGDLKRLIATPERSLPSEEERVIDVMEKLSTALSNSLKISLQ